MLGIGCPDRHALPRHHPDKMYRPAAALPSRASGFVLRRSAADGGRCREGPLTDPIADAQACRWELVKMPQTLPLHTVPRVRSRFRIVAALALSFRSMKAPWSTLARTTGEPDVAMLRAHILSLIASSHIAQAPAWQGIVRGNDLRIRLQHTNSV